MLHCFKITSYCHCLWADSGHFFSTHAVWNDEHRKHNPSNRRFTYKVVQITRYVHLSFTSPNSKSSSGNDRSACSIIRFLNIIQNSTKPWEREDSACCILFKQMFPLYWTELLKINTPWKRGNRAQFISCFPSMHRCRNIPIYRFKSPWEHCQRLEYRQGTFCYWTALRNSSVPTYFCSPSLTQQHSKGGSADAELFQAPECLLPWRQ